MPSYKYVENCMFMNFEHFEFNSLQVCLTKILKPPNLGLENPQINMICIYQERNLIYLKYCKLKPLIIHKKSCAEALQVLNI